MKLTVGRQRCEGSYAQGPGKRYVRCPRCGHISYDDYEGDRCRGDKRRGLINGGKAA